MTDLYYDPTPADLRQLVHDGALVVLGATAEGRALIDHAAALIAEAFGGVTPEHAHTHLPVERFVDTVAPLKTAFTNGAATKRLLETWLLALGHDPERTYYDVPRLRVIPPYEYLHAGVSYAYRPHRDTWYSAEQCQLNWWTPVFPITGERAMWMYPEYWQRPVENSSAGFDYGAWQRESRPAAAGLTTVDTRPHPLPIDEVRHDAGLRFVVGPGQVLVFSAAHLHGSVPNTTDRVRFSIDWRTIDSADLATGVGPARVDEECTGTTAVDFVRVGDGAPLISPVGAPA